MPSTLTRDSAQFRVFVILGGNEIVLGGEAAAPLPSPSSGTVQYFRTPEDPFPAPDSAAARTMASFKNGRDDWDTHGSPAPSNTAIELAELVLALLQARGHEVARVARMADGGISMTVTTGTRRAKLGILNSLDSWLETEQLDGAAERVRESVDVTTHEGRGEAIESITRFLQTT